MRLISWNVNGIRAIAKKGFAEWLEAESPDIVCLQETKAQPEQIPEPIKEAQGYHTFWNSAERKGYSGVGTLSKLKPLTVTEGLGIPEFDNEGRVLHLEYDDFHLFNIYFPNGKARDERLKYKLAFYDAFLDLVDDLIEKGKGIVVCGDLNTAHKPIDLARPKENEKYSGFLPVERKWMDKLISHGYVDTFRHFCDEGDHYSWWAYKTRARERNVGWRIDYFFVSKDLVSQLNNAFIMSDVMGSDHCPLGIEIVFDD